MQKQKQKQKEVCNTIHNKPPAARHAISVPGRPFLVEGQTYTANSGKKMPFPTALSYRNKFHQPPLLRPVMSHRSNCRGKLCLTAWRLGASHPSRPFPLAALCSPPQAQPIPPSPSPLTKTPSQTKNDQHVKSVKALPCGRNTPIHQGARILHIPIVQAGSQRCTPWVPLRQQEAQVAMRGQTNGTQCSRQHDYASP